LTELLAAVSDIEAASSKARRHDSNQGNCGGSGTFAPMSADIIITADSSYQLWFNGI
jgi:hypothetical protein